MNISEYAHENGWFDQTINGSEFANSYFVENFAPHILLSLHWQCGMGWGKNQEEDKDEDKDDGNDDNDNDDDNDNSDDNNIDNDNDTAAADNADNNYNLF